MRLFFLQWCGLCSITCPVLCVIMITTEKLCTSYCGLATYREGHSARDVAQPCGILSCGRSTVCCLCCQNVIDSLTTTVVVQAFQSLKRGHQEFRCLGRFRSRSQTCMSSHARLQPMWERQRCLLFWDRVYTIMNSWFWPSVGLVYLSVLCAIATARHHSIERSLLCPSSFGTWFYWVICRRPLLHSSSSALGNLNFLCLWLQLLLRTRVTTEFTTGCFPEVVLLRFSCRASNKLCISGSHGSSFYVFKQTHLFCRSLNADAKCFSCPGCKCILWRCWHKAHCAFEPFRALPRNTTRQGN